MKENTLIKKVSCARIIFYCKIEFLNAAENGESNFAKVTYVS